MKLLVMSDSHGKIENMLYAVKNTEHDAIVHLGDYVKDVQALKREVPDCVIYSVTGNGDSLGSAEREIFMTLDGVKILITHGHDYDVKNGLHLLQIRAKELEADLVLYGHTHQSSIINDFGRWFMNPGQMQMHLYFMPATYGIVTIENGLAACTLAHHPTLGKQK